MDVLFEDADIIVIDKPAGRIVHPAPGHETGSLTEELVRRCPSMAGVGSVERPGVVHRLDQDTSGVVVFAKTQAAYLDLRRQFESHETVEKKYLATLHGAPAGKKGEKHIPRAKRAAKQALCGVNPFRFRAKGTIDTPVGRERLRAITHWEVLAKHGAVALVQFTIETGRMHQIRIHAAELGHPVVGDRTYGDAEKDRRLKVKPKRHLLHAVELSFLHPKTHRRVTFTAPPPADIVYAG